MLSRSLLRRYSGSRSYEKGEDIFFSGKVTNFEAQEEDGYISLSAQVKGSARNSLYNVSLLYDPENDGLVESYCDCPAYYGYGTICKHCVALALTYRDRELAKKYRQKNAGSAAAANAFRQGQNTPAKKARPTTPAFRDMLVSRRSRKLNTVKHADMIGKVSLEPLLKKSYFGPISVEFKIGAEQKYVLKSVDDFERRMQNHEEFAYGKKLTLVHYEEAFTEESKPILDFIMKYMTAHRNFAGRSMSGYYYSMTPVGREMPLPPEELEHFLLALGERTIAVDGSDRVRQMQVKIGQKPPRRMTITGEKDGISVSVEKQNGYVGENYYIYFSGNDIILEPAANLEKIGGFLQMMAQLEGKDVFIASADVPLFYRELYPALQEEYEITLKDFDPESYAVQEAEFEFYLDEPEAFRIEIKTLACYGEEKFNLLDTVRGQEKRDLVREAEIRRVLDSMTNEAEPQVLVLSGDEEAECDFLENGIHALEELGTVMVTDKIRHLEVRKAPRVSVGVSVESNLLDLQLTSDDMTLAELADILSRYQKKKKYYRLADGSFIRIEDQGLDMLADMMNTMGFSTAQLRKGTVELPKYRAMYLDSALKNSQDLSVDRSKTFRALVRNMKTVEDNDFEIPASLKKVLRDYQKTGFLWLKTIAANGFGGILADDMGLGKTLQVISFLSSEMQEKDGDYRALIVCPASLVYNWKSEFERFAPELPAVAITGNAGERSSLLKQSEGRQIFITSYDLLKRDIDSYEEMKFAVEVIDEAQFIKNSNTQAAKAVKQVHAGCRLALTGTPIENRLSELWSIFDYMMPGFLFTRASFQKDFETAIMKNRDAEAMEKLKRMIRPFILRRLKGDVLKDLPEKMEERVFSNLEGEQQKLYDAHVKRLRLMLDKDSDEDFRKSKIQVLAELTKLRQLCCDPSLLYMGYEGGSSKLETCMELIGSAVDSCHKLLLFSQFTSMLDIIAGRLKKAGIPYYLLTGSTGKEERKRLVDAFQNDGTPVFLISLKAGGTGLNLTAADIVIHYDPWWNIAVQNQATDRVHRIGQKNTVTAYQLIAKGTIEEKISDMQQQKKELADQVLSGESIGSGSITREELLALLA